MAALTPAVTALWRTAGTRIAAAGLPPDLPNRDAMVLVAGAFAAATAAAYAEEKAMHEVLAFELLTGGAMEAWGQLSRVEVMSVEMTVARCWRAIVSEFAHLRGVSEVAGMSRDGYQGPAQYTARAPWWKRLLHAWRARREARR
ncbi:hypothetical protein [Mycobacterium sp. 155]|uniref:hypothetical protein n=1 Tax=Mycobacterium sp. 155 TaxID=1157943 RepID=UPI00037C968E|nr:hypothetical protein [Mycobacterium sp. 155]